MMTTPISTFQSSADASAWFVASTTDGKRTYTTNGKAFNSALQDAIKTSSVFNNPLQTYDGSRISSSTIRVDGIWGPGTYKALWAYVNAKGGSQLDLNAIAASARAARPGVTIPSPIVAIAAAAILYEQQVQLTHMPFIPSNALLPRYDIDAGGLLIAPMVGTPSTDEEAAIAMGTASPSASSPAPSSTPAPSAPPPSDTSTPAPRSTSTSSSSSSGTRSSKPIPVGQTPSTIVTGSGLTMGPIVVGLAGLAVLVYLGFQLAKPKKLQAATPTRRIKTSSMRRRAHA